MLEEEKQRECVPTSDGLWVWWQITGHSCCHRDRRGSWRWITHQRSSVNHQSPLTPRHRHPPPSSRNHLHRLAVLHIRRGCRKISRSRWVVLTNQPERTCTPPPPCSILFLYQPSFSFPLFPAVLLHNTSDSAPALFFLSPFALPRLLFPPFLIFLSSNVHSPSPPPVSVPPQRISLVGHLPARHLRASKSLLTF